MKLSLLVLSLVIIYGTCIIYAAEVKDVDSTEDVTNAVLVCWDICNIQDAASTYSSVRRVAYWFRYVQEHEDSCAYSDEKYISDYQYEPLQTSLSRQKRSVFSPMTFIIKIFGKGAAPIFRRIFNSYLILIGMKECSKVEDLSFGNIIKNFIKEPFKTVDNVLCKFLDIIGSQGRALLAKVAKMAIKFGKKVLIPGLHTFLNKLKDTGYMPSSIVALINMFNVAYKFMKLVGYL